MKLLKIDHVFARVTLLTLGFFFAAGTAWAGPYSGGQFGLYGLYVFLYLGPPAILILATAKALFWSKLASEAGEERFFILKIAASAIFSVIEFLAAALLVGIMATLAHQAPLLDEIDRYTLWGALTGWGLFFLLLGNMDIAGNRRLLKMMQSRHPDKIFTESSIMTGAWCLWVGLGLVIVPLVVIWQYIF